MIECRRELILPCVDQSTADADDLFNELLAATVDGALPGFKVVPIEPDISKPDIHQDVHSQAIDDVFRGVAAVGSKAQTGTTVLDRGTRDMGQGIGMHVDYSRYGGVLDKDSLSLTLRVHTNGMTNVARGVLVNSSPSFGQNVGDHDLYGFVPDRTELQHRGYDLTNPLTTSAKVRLIAKVMGGSYDPTLTSGDFFGFEQGPLQSIVFRTRADYGPVAFHDFRSTNPDRPRFVCLSDITLKSLAL